MQHVWKVVGATARAMFMVLVALFAAIAMAINAGMTENEVLHVGVGVLTALPIAWAAGMLVDDVLRGIVWLRDRRHRLA